jgi:hypothetical protein
LKHGWDITIYIYIIENIISNMEVYNGLYLFQTRKIITLIPGFWWIVPTIAGLRSADQGFNLTQDRLGLLNLNLRRVSTLEDRRLGEVPG